MLQIREGATTGDELTRGLPGEPLTPGDKTLLELKPLKAFLSGEVRFVIRRQASLAIAAMLAHSQLPVAIIGSSMYESGV